MQIKKSITIQDSDNLNRYFSEIRGFNSLTKEEEKDLIIRIQESNDQKALTKLINANLKFVVSIAKIYQGQGAPLMDLISEGNAGMIEAAYRFDLKKDIKFFSYAVWWIRKKMFSNIDYNKRIIQLPANRELLVPKVKKAVQNLEQDLCRLPTVEEIVNYINDNNKKTFSVFDIYSAIIHGTQFKSLQERIDEHSDSEDLLQDFIAGDMDIDIHQSNESIIDELNRFLFHLTQKEYDILCLITGIGGQKILDYKQISNYLDIKIKDINRFKNKAVKRLRRLKNIDILKDFL